MEINIALFKEEDRWIAQALEYNVRAQGENKEMAVHELMRLVHAYMAIGSLVDQPPAPECYWNQKTLTITL